MDRVIRILLVSLALTVAVPSMSYSQDPTPSPEGGGPSAGDWITHWVQWAIIEWALCLTRRETCKENCSDQAEDLRRDGMFKDMEEALRFYLSCVTDCARCS